MPNVFLICVKKVKSKFGPKTRLVYVRARIPVQFDFAFKKISGQFAFILFFFAIKLQK